MQSKELKEKEANLDDSLSRLSADVSQADKEWNDHILAKTGHADIDAKAQHANDVVAEMTEEEIEENKQIIKKYAIFFTFHLSGKRFPKKLSVHTEVATVVGDIRKNRQYLQTVSFCGAFFNHCTTATLYSSNTLTV